MQYRKKVDINPMNSITSILILVLIFVGLYFIAKSIFTLLAWAAPVLLVATLLIDYKVVVNYGKWIVNLLTKNPLMGIGMILVSFFGFPVIAGFLFAKSLLTRKVRKLRNEYETKTQGEYVDYEEVEEEPPIRLNFPKMDKQKQSSKDNDYDQYFD